MTDHNITNSNEALASSASFSQKGTHMTRIEPALGATDKPSAKHAVAEYSLFIDYLNSDAILNVMREYGDDHFAFAMENSKAWVPMDEDMLLAFYQAYRVEIDKYMFISHEYLSEGNDEYPSIPQLLHIAIEYWFTDQLDGAMYTALTNGELESEDDYVELVANR